MIFNAIKIIALAVFVSLVTLLVIPHSQTNQLKILRRKADSTRYPRLAIIREHISKLNGEMELESFGILKESGMFARHGFQWNNGKNNSYLYYKITTTVKASAEIGILEYNNEEQDYYVLYGRDCPTNYLIVYTDGSFYIIPGSQIATPVAMFHKTIVKYILSNRWRKKEFELNNNEPSGIIWDAPTESDLYSISSLTEYFWSGQIDLN